MLNIIFFLFAFFAFIALVIGLIKPNIVIKWGDKKTRKHVVLIYGTAILVFFVLSVITFSPIEKKPLDENQMATKPEIIPQPTEEIQKPEEQRQIETSQTTISSNSKEEQKLEIGDVGIINYRDDKNDCSGDDLVILGVSREAQEKVDKALYAKDTIGIAQLLANGEAFAVDICTKAKIIDSAVALREVRILEGKNMGKSGWLPYEWIR